MGSKATCVSKKQYYADWGAQIQADDINLHHGYEKISVYKCPYCNYYHLTSMNK